MDEGQAELLTDILEDVVQSGTGKRAAIPGRQIAGKTGTTDNYGDAWFVGYTPELVVAVWVGYPDALKPMLTEFNGEPVAGGTLPAHDLEGVRREGPRGRSAAFTPRPTSAAPRRGSSGATASGSSTTATAAERGSSPTSPARGRTRGRLQAERGVGAARRRNDRGRSRGDARRAAAGGEDRLRAGEGRAGCPASSSTRIRARGGLSANDR